MTQDQLVASLVATLQQAQLFMDSYCVCAPSRIKAETNEQIELALSKARAVQFEVGA